jgi:hypothetical protein
MLLRCIVILLLCVFLVHSLFLAIVAFQCCAPPSASSIMLAAELLVSAAG